MPRDTVRRRGLKSVPHDKSCSPTALPSTRLKHKNTFSLSVDGGNIASEIKGSHGMRLPRQSVRVCRTPGPPISMLGRSQRGALMRLRSFMRLGKGRRLRFNIEIWGQGGWHVGEPRGVAKASHTFSLAIFPPSTVVLDGSSGLSFVSGRTRGPMYDATQWSPTACFKQLSVTA